METEQLRTFVTVARTGSFTATARELGYVQSTVSGHLRTLEGRLGVRLLDRLPAGAVLTEAGSRMLKHAARMLDLETSLIADALPPGGPVTGHVRLVAPESLCAYRLPAMIALLRQAAPHLRLTLVPAGTAEGLSALRGARADLALIVEPSFSADDLSLTALGEEPLTLLSSPRLGPAGPGATWGELAAHDALLLEEGCSYSDEVARQLLAVGQPDSRRVRFGSIETVKRCIAAGSGWTVLPAVTADDDLRAGLLVAGDAPLPPRPTVYAATHRDRTLNAGVELVLGHLAPLWPTDQGSDRSRPAGTS